MYEAVRGRPASPTSVARLAATAADYGFEGVVVANPPDAPPDGDVAAVQATAGTDIVRGVELTPEGPTQASGAIGNVRPRTTVLCLRGGTPALNRFAVSRSKVDVLTRPMADVGDLDHVLVRTAADHGVRLAVELGPVLRATDEGRTAAIAALRKLRELIEDADAPYVVTGRPASHLELRSPRELAAVAAVAGYDRAAVEAGLAEWGRIAARNRERLSDGAIASGVRLEDDPE